MFQSIPLFGLKCRNFWRGETAWENEFSKKGRFLGYNLQRNRLFQKKSKKICE